MVADMKAIFSYLWLQCTVWLRTRAFKPYRSNLSHLPLRDRRHSNADAPSTIDGMQTVKTILGCSVERAWWRTRDAAFIVDVEMMDTRELKVLTGISMCSIALEPIFPRCMNEMNEKLLQR